jgi:hypothetical protein
MTLPKIFNTYAAGADYVDHKTSRTSLPLREFLAGFLSHYPWWIKALYEVRAGLVRVLGIRQRLGGYQLTPAADQIPFAPGQQATIFKVRQAVEDQYWIAEASDKHLTATLGVVREPAGDQAVFHIVTLVHHHHWTGPVYFNLIRPFHHLVVGSMIQAGVGSGQDRPRGASLGLWLLAIALLHQAVGMYFYWDGLVALWRDGVLNAIGLNWDRDCHTQNHDAASNDRAGDRRESEHRVQPDRAASNRLRYHPPGSQTRPAGGLLRHRPSSATRKGCQ